MVDGVRTDVTMTITGFVSVTPFETADGVTKDVIKFVVGGRADAEMNDVTMFVVLGSTVVVVSGMGDCVVDKMADETDEAMEEEIAAATDEDSAAAAALVMEDSVLVTATLVSAIMKKNR